MQTNTNVNIYSDININKYIKHWDGHKKGCYPRGIIVKKMQTNTNVNIYSDININKYKMTR